MIKTTDKILLLIPLSVIVYLIYSASSYYYYSHKINKQFYEDLNKCIGLTQDDPVKYLFDSVKVGMSQSETEEILKCYDDFSIIINDDENTFRYTYGIKYGMHIAFIIYYDDNNRVKNKFLQND